MVINGLYQKGYTELANEIAANHYRSVFEVYKNTGTFWEYYAPEAIEPGFMARKDFVGWTGLPPIAVFIEYILGIKSDFSENMLTWDIVQTEAHGISNYPFGPEGTVSLKVSERKNQGEVPRITVESTVSFKMRINWGKGQTREVEIKPGTQTI
jgi:hypothetical protein